MSSEEQNAGAKPPPGARFFSEQERTDHVANVMEALTKQGLNLQEIPAEQQKQMDAFVKDGTACELHIKTPKGFVQCVLQNLTNA